MYNTGYHWLSGSELTADGDVNTSTYGDISNWVSQKRLSADKDDNKIAILDTEGAKALAVIATASAITGDSGTTNVDFNIYGAIGLGETTQKSWDNNPVHLTFISAHTIATPSSGDGVVLDANEYGVGGTSQLSLVHPSGNAHYQYVGGGTQTTGSAFKVFGAIAMSAKASTLEDLPAVDLPGANGTPDDAGFGLIYDISAFQKVIFSLNFGSATAVSADALVARLY